MSSMSTITTFGEPVTGVTGPIGRAEVSTSIGSWVRSGFTMVRLIVVESRDRRKHPTRRMSTKRLLSRSFLFARFSGEVLPADLVVRRRGPLGLPTARNSEELLNRRITGVVGVVAGLALAATTMPGIASAAPDIDDLPAPANEPQAKSDNFHDPLAAKRTALRQRAVDELVAGTAKTVGKGKNRTIQLAEGTEVDYPVTQTAQLLTFLVQFGDGTGNPAFPTQTAGPLHNELTEPAESDNSTYWEPDFSQEHFRDMFFNGLPDQDGESFHDVYDEMSSGKFDLQGDVSDWVTVEHPASYYSSATGDEDAASMTSFIQDGADAWYDAQVAAGQTDAQIKAYLATFDVWDRYDFDADGDFNEPDGYIDHFQAIHAGGGEEAGAEPWAIWSHRWSVNGAEEGPATNPSGGVQIGDTGLWIRDYTTEPENGGLGVFAHEFGHDLGLPDYYDTNGGDNSTAFWTLMSSGSWMGHGTGSIGTTPNHMGATEKLFLGWYGTDELAIVDGTGTPEEVDLGPSYHATTTGAQAIAVTLPDGSSEVDVVEPDAGNYLYSGTGDGRVATATSPTLTVPAADPTLKARVSYSIEDDWDYAYLKVSDDGGATWDYVETDLSTTTDPFGQNAGFGITGCSGTRDGDGVCDNAWTDLTADLTAYAGVPVKVEFEMFNDGGYHELGFSVDSIALGATVVADIEDDAAGWTLDGFRVLEGSSYEATYDRYYLAENRQYRGYDATLAEGPYSFDYAETAPDQVDQFPYQDGLLVWYANGLYTDNNTSAHPGGGSALPVDASPTYEVWTEGDVTYNANGRLNAFDATFDVDETDGLHLTTETGTGSAAYDVDAQPSVPVFEDTDVNAYWDDSVDGSGQYSTQVAGAGTMLQVLSSDETTGAMTVKVGSRFVAATTAAAITGTPALGQTLTAVAPEFFQDGVATSYQWQVDGTPILGAGDSTYVVQPAQAGKQVGVVVTGSKDGYLAAKETVTVAVPLNAAPVATAAPVVAGTPQVGQTLTVTPGAWPVAGTSTFTWAAGAQILGTGTSYVAKPADAGKQVTVTETRTATGYQPGTSASVATAAVQPAPTTLSAKAPKKVKKGAKAKVKITVASPGLVPTGSVKVTYHGKKVAAKVLSDGTVTIKLPKQSKKGKKKVVVTYVPDTGYVASTTTLTIKIT
jgi:immune inhibitor A